MGPADTVTPYHRLERLGAALGIDLWVKREDLYPHDGGGNKARKFGLIGPAVRRGGHDAIVTTGAVHSNHARVAALVAARMGWACRLVLHGSAGDAGHSLNAWVMQQAGAHIRVVAADEVAVALEDAVDALAAEGRRPTLVPGGGHLVEGSLAYVTVMQELHEQAARAGHAVDHIVLASGTGTTQAGLHVGAEVLGTPTRVVGVSIARPMSRAVPIIDEACRSAREALGSTAPHRAVTFLDEWVEGGYGRSSGRLRRAVGMALRTEGLLLDETYSGKAVLALAEMARDGRIGSGSRVCLVHTGGWSSLRAPRELPAGRPATERVAG